MWKLRDYVGFALLATIAFFKGLWTGLAQIPGYVSAEIRSAKSTTNNIAKTRETGRKPTAAKARFSLTQDSE